MMRNTLRRAKGVLLALVLLLAAVPTASAVTYDLCAAETTLTMPDGQAVTMWGLGLDTGGQCVPTIPGPTLRVGPTDPSLTVNLRNTLSEPVSLHILGQQLSVNRLPVWDNGTAGNRPNLAARVRSFSNEAAPNGGTRRYRWGTDDKPFKAGTYLLQSGTNPAKQVQMGISAPVIKDSGAGVAYADNPNIPGDQSVPYTREVLLVFQEIDAAIHAAVAAGTYGPGGTITSSAYREPNYFLINGKAYPDASLNPLNAAQPISAGERTLFRFINAGAETHVPQILNGYMSLVAEDGIPLKYPQERYGLELNPSKTLDAVFTPDGPGNFKVLDGRLNLSNAGTYPGGMLALVNVSGDAVNIKNVTYDAAARTLTVVATSSLQPDVTLNATGFGKLFWRESSGQYRRTFTGVSALPANVTVQSSGGGSATYTFPETVTIERAIYHPGAQTLTVVATTSLQPDVTLNANGLGKLYWRASSNQYRRTFAGVPAKPANVTVQSSGGGSATTAVQ
ncbi:MAG: hypothetical protein CVU57_02695 [Deltaproteobacteria bacterium HGW-Deltaproteobacteria-15]|jgi:FtsP/CotA-like multicopper oxidase with cupredoxin domain|nr:MAG: hypothetical protein CVU57_02695 [Deltaproteobacteria bacterium HGW-Deltaproteobacteria-15]